MELPVRVLGYLTLFCYLLHLTQAATPVFTHYSPGEITEGLQPGTFYYQFKATDPTPGDVVTYSLDSSGSEWFNINSTSGEATVKKTIDREEIGSVLKYKVKASDGSYETEKTIFQRIKDINDNPPVFTNLPKNISIKEDFPVGSLVFTVSATDADINNAGLFVFSIETGNEEGRFELPNPAEGKINLKKSLDYDDGTQTFVLRIVAKNTLADDPKLNSTSVLTINIKDVDDLGPKFVKNLYEATIVKDSPPDTVVTTVQAIDGDSFNDTVEYDLYQETNPGNVYKINNNTGEITVNGPLTIGKQLLVVTAKSTTYPPTFTVVEITVASMLNMSYIVSVYEGESNLIVYNLEPAEKFYNISGGTFSIIASAQSSLFTIDGKNLKVGGTPLDRETQDLYQLNIALDKDGSRKGVVMIVIKVLDMNDNSPAFLGSIPYEVDVKEDQKIGKIILNITAKDGDSGDNGTVRYTIIAGNEQGKFSIDNITGEISINTSLDREKTAQYTLTVQAYDGGSPPLTNTTNVTLNVLDVNDNSPSFTSRVINFTISEDTALGVEIARVTANDSDEGKNREISYSIVTGSFGKFVIDKITGAIKTSGSLSFKERPKYTLFVDAEDDGEFTRSGSTLVNIMITSAGVNLYTPVFTKNEYLGGVYKDTSDDQLILTVSATDADIGTNGEVVYELTDNRAPFLFYFETVTGRLRSANSFLEKEGKLYILKAIAKDKATPPKTSTAANLSVFVLRESYSVVITADVSQDFILKNIEEFRGVLDDLTGGKTFIKSVRPKDGGNSSSEIVINAIKNKTELTSAQIQDLLKGKEDEINDKYKKWHIRTYEPPQTLKRISAGGLSAIVGAMICLAVLIGVGGIIMIIILIKKRRERERIRKNARVTFKDDPQYINIDGSLPVSKLREVESAQEAYMADENSSVVSEEVQTSPDVLNYINDAYHNDDHDGHEQEEGFFDSSDRVEFGTFFPPPPTEPPPPVPDSDVGSLASEEESINSDENDPDYINAVLPPHEDFADNNNTPRNNEERNGDSPTHSYSDSTSQLINSSSYKDTLLHDPTFGFDALRRSSNPELTTEL